MTDSAADSRSRHQELVEAARSICNPKRRAETAIRERARAEDTTPAPADYFSYFPFFLFLTAPNSVTTPVAWKTYKGRLRTHEKSIGFILRPEVVCTYIFVDFAAR